MKNKVNIKGKTLLTILYIIVLVVIIIGTSFAFFTTQLSGTPSKITIETAKLGTAFASGTSVELYVDSKDMNYFNGRNDYSVYKEPEDSATLSVTTSTGDTDGIECTYDIVYNPVVVYTKSIANTGNLMEFTVVANPEIRSGAEYTTITGTMPEADLTGASTTVTLVHKATLRVTGEGKTGEVVWLIKPRYYNLAINQSDNVSKTFGGTIEVGRLVCIGI